MKHKEHEAFIWILWHKIKRYIKFARLNIFRFWNKNKIIEPYTKRINVKDLRLIDEACGWCDECELTPPPMFKGPQVPG